MVYTKIGEEVQTELKDTQIVNFVRFRNVVVRAEGGKEELDIRLESMGESSGFVENMANLRRNFAFQMYKGLMEVKCLLAGN